MTTLYSVFILNGSSSFLHITRTTIKAWVRLNFIQIPSPTSCPKASEKPIYNVVTTLVPSYLIGSSFLQITRTAKNLGGIQNSAISDQGLQS